MSNVDDPDLGPEVNRMISDLASFYRLPVDRCMSLVLGHVIDRIISDNPNASFAFEH